MDRRQFKGLNEGLPSCNWRSHPFWSCAHTQHFPRLLLLCTEKFIERKCTWMSGPSTWTVSPSPLYFPRDGHPWTQRKGLFITTTTFHVSLLTSHPGVWCTEQVMFIDHWIKAYQSRQEALETFKPFQSFGTNAYYEPMPWQACHCKSWLWKLWHAQGLCPLSCHTRSQASAPWRWQHWWESWQWRKWHGQWYSDAWWTPYSKWCPFGKNAR